MARFRRVSPFMRCCDTPVGWPRCRKLLCTRVDAALEACSQFDSCMTLVMPRCVSGACVHSNSGGAGCFSGGPM